MTDEETEEIFERFEVDQNGTTYWRNDLSISDFSKVVMAMGWANNAEFTRETGVEYADVKGKYFTVIGHPARVFTEEELTSDS